MRAMIGALLLAGLMAGCGGAVAEPEPETPGTVEATALCSDCSWIYVKCMGRATTPEARQNCEYGRIDCEETWCTGLLAGEDAPSATSNPYCWNLDSSPCASIGTKRNCTDGVGGTFACYCRTGEWDCPPYDEPL
ncbi:hypothetical protein ACLESD_04895 [Pyxidicoccus sp. 3LFB2]